MSATSETVIEIPQGKLRGKRETSVLGDEFFSFMRIPYAKPPVGELRFKAPQPADGWTGIRDATEQGKVCPSTDWQRTTYLKECDEDCLFINVYCKQDPNSVGRKKLPVLLWIHGGGFELGSGNKNMCGPDYFMRHQVLLVTFNYRLGPMGFLSLQTVECPGNFGLKDQRLAIEWVSKNIACFGGDPENVTIFGISAGGASVQYQTMCLSNKGLFKRAIAQSGSSLNKWAHQSSPRENAFILGRRLGCDTKDDRVLLDFLKKKSAEEITLKAQGICFETQKMPPGEHFLQFTFVPSTEPEHEGAFFSKHPWVLLKEGHYLDVPLITGICEKEMIIGLKEPNNCPAFNRVEEFQEFIPRTISPGNNTERSLAMAKRLKEVYFKNGIDIDSYIDILSDTGFNYGVYKVAKCRTANAAVKSPTYLYVFSYQGDQPFIKELMGLTQIKGTSHGEDTCYLFTTEFTNPATMIPGTRDYKMMSVFTELWVNFATSGVPAVQGAGFAWKAATSENLEYLALGESLEMRKGFLPERMALWDEFYSAHYDRP